MQITRNKMKPGIIYLYRNVANRIINPILAYKQNIKIQKWVYPKYRNDDTRRFHSTQKRKFTQIQIAEWKFSFFSFSLLFIWSFEFSFSFSIWFVCFHFIWLHHKRNLKHTVASGVFEEIRNKNFKLVYKVEIGTEGLGGGKLEKPCDNVEMDENSQLLSYLCWYRLSNHSPRFKLFMCLCVQVHFKWKVEGRFEKSVEI